MKRLFLHRAYIGSALVITLMFIVLLGLEALVVGLLLSRSAGTEAILRGKNQSVRRASELVLNSLSQTIYNDMVSNNTLTTILNNYTRGGGVSTYWTLTSNRYYTTNPESGSSDQLGIDTAAWIQENRGNYFHLVGRAKYDDVDLITHKWVLIKPCAAGAGASVLTTIISGIRYPGYNSTVVDPNTGRVFFGAAEDSYYSASNLYSWLPATGLSTIVSGRGGVGNRAIHMASDGRLFFGEYGIGDYFWTWKNGILSTIMPSAENGAGRGCATCLTRFMYDSASSRIYFGTNYGGYTWTWKNNVLSTIADDGGYITTMAIGGVDEAAYVYDTGSNYLLKRWTPSNQNETLTDLTAAGITTAPGASNQITVSGSNILFSEHSWTSNNRFFVYNRGSGIITQLPGTYYGGVYTFPMSGGKIFLGDNAVPMRYWDSSSPGTLTTIGGQSWAGTTMNADRTLVVFANSSAGSELNVWGPTTGLSTVPGSAGFTTAMEGTYDVDNDGNNDVQFFGSGNNWYNNSVLFFGESRNPGRFYQWNATTQKLSTLMTGTRNVGVAGAVAVNSSGQVFFGTNTTSANSAGFYAHSPSAGLVTIVTGRNYPGVFSTKINPLTGGVYFGEGTTTGNFYYYETISNCATRPY